MTVHLVHDVCLMDEIGSYFGFPLELVLFGFFEVKMSLPMYRGKPALGTFFVPRAVRPVYFSGPRAACPGQQGYQPWVQDGNSGLTALGTFLYRRQPALCTFLDQGQPALGTKTYLGLSALVTTQ